MQDKVVGKKGTPLGDNLQLNERGGFIEESRYTPGEGEGGLLTAGNWLPASCERAGGGISRWVYL